MENVKVVKMFRNKDTGILHSVGETVQLSSDRAKELADRGYVSEVSKVIKTKEEKASPETKEEKVKTESKEPETK
jgi:hypothetical protein